MAVEHGAGGRIGREGDVRMPLVGAIDVAARLRLDHLDGGDAIMARKEGLGIVRVAEDARDLGLLLEG